MKTKTDKRAWVARIMAGVLAAVTLLGICLPAFAAEALPAAGSHMAGTLPADGFGTVCTLDDGEAPDSNMKTKRGEGGCVRRDGFSKKQIRKSFNGYAVRQFKKDLFPGFAKKSSKSDMLDRMVRMK